MPYTLMKGLGWFLLALLLGIVIGWMLRHVTARRQVARARAHHVDTAELERLRGRVANLEPAVAERDRLRVQLDELRTASRPVSAPAPVLDPGLGPSVAPITALAEVLAAPDVAGAAAVFGKPVTLDDLKLIEGVGPKIEALCHGIGIRTWFDLSTTEVSLLRTMLADAGPRFRTHDPATWPQQAALLAAGQWQEFKALTDSLRGGKSE
jgi:predicted flap endonuclease-1-like 5' DNA nuclease